MPQALLEHAWLLGDQRMDAENRSEQEYKLPLRQWLISKLDQHAFLDVEWINKEEGIFKIPWTQKHYPNWKEHFQIFRAWAIHKDKYDEDNPPDEKKLKGNFRCALHKSVDFEELSNSSAMGQQTGNYKIYRVLKREEVKEKNRQKKKNLSQSQRQGTKHYKKAVPMPPMSQSIKMSPGHFAQEASASFQGHGAMQQGYNPVQTQGFTNHTNPIQEGNIDDLTELHSIAFQNDVALAPNAADGGFVQRTLDGIPPLPQYNAATNRAFEFDFPATPDDQDHSITDLDESKLMFSPGNSAQTYNEAAMSIENEQAPSYQDPPPQTRSIMEFMQTINIDIKDMFKFEVEIKYDSKVVDHQVFDCTKGRRIFYGDESMQKAIVELFQHSAQAKGFDCPGYAMPKCFAPPNENLFQILTKTDQGFTLRCDNLGNLWVTRLSQSVLYYFDLEKSTEPIKLERYKPIMLITHQDLAKKAIQRRSSNGRRPSNEFRLYVGSKPRNPSHLTPVMLNICSVAASKMIDTLFGSEHYSMLAFSQQNSLDNLLRML